MSVKIEIRIALSNGGYGGYTLNEKYKSPEMIRFFAGDSAIYR